MDSWQRDWGRPERLLFLHDSLKFRLRRFLVRERTCWAAIAVAALYVAARMLGGAA